MTRPCSHVSLLALCLLAAPLFAKGGYTVTVANPLDEPRASEVVEVAASSPTAPSPTIGAPTGPRSAVSPTSPPGSPSSKPPSAASAPPLTVTVTQE